MSLLIEAAEKHKRVTFKRLHRELHDTLKDVYTQMEWLPFLDTDLSLLEAEFIFSLDLIHVSSLSPLSKAAIRERDNLPTSNACISFHDWPEAIAQRAIQVCKVQRITKVKHFELLRDDADWEQLTLPPGVKYYLRRYEGKFNFEEARTVDSRMRVSHGEHEYEVDRYCPHKGADLLGCVPDAKGIITCPKHNWKFNLEQGGRCTVGNSQCSLNAKLLW